MHALQARFRLVSANGLSLELRQRLQTLHPSPSWSCLPLVGGRPAQGYGLAEASGWESGFKLALTWCRKGELARSWPGWDSWCSCAAPTWWRSYELQELHPLRNWPRWHIVARVEDCRSTSACTLFTRSRT